MQRPHDRDKLRRGFVALGVEAGDTLFVHASFKSIGKVKGGAGSVVAALEEAVGPGGLVLMPSFNLIDRDERPKVWDVKTTPSTVGWLTEYFRLMPGTCRSDHYSHSVAARGKGAQEIVDSHLRQEGLRSRWDLAPWGHTFGAYSPMYRAYEAGGKVLMLGVDYTSSTYIHLAEIVYRTRHLDGDRMSKHPITVRTKLGAWWDRTGDLSIGHVGDAECRLFLIRDYVDSVTQELEFSIDEYLDRYI